MHEVRSPRALLGGTQEQHTFGPRFPVFGLSLSSRSVSLLSRWPLIWRDRDVSIHDFVSQILMLPHTGTKFVLDSPQQSRLIPRTA
jgi:hypothetical protein